MEPTSDGDYSDYAPAMADLTSDVRLAEPGPLERFRIAEGDGPAEIRRKNRAAMEAMVTEVG